MDSDLLSTLLTQVVIALASVPKVCVYMQILILIHSTQERTISRSK